jgi:ComF family protein
VHPQLSRLTGAALDLLFPKYCVGCGKDGSFICRHCQQSLKRITAPICPRCGRPQPDGTLCHDCRDWRAAIDGIRSPFRFEGVIREAIHQLKYGNLRALAPVLAGLLYVYLKDNPIPVEVFVPVPMHQKRLRERGYNQSTLLARELAKLTGLPVGDDCLVRQRHTPPQARTASVQERKSNIADAFACGDSAPQGRQVLLIDDVATSGTTLDACAAALKAVGAVSAWGLTVAREI